MSINCRGALFALLSSLAISATAADIVIGQVAPFSGPLAPTANHLRAGAQLYFDAVNAKGGIHGNKLRLISKDDGYKASETLQKARELLAESQPMALFGFVGTGNVEAILKEKILDNAATPLITVRTGASIVVNSGNPWIFLTRASYAQEIDKIVQQYETIGYKRFAVFYQNDAYGKSGLSGVTKALTARQLKPTAEATVERNSVDVADAVGKLAKSGAQAIVQIGSYKACAAFIREAKKAGYGGKFYNVSFVGTQALADELGKDGAGVVVSQVVPSPYNPARPIAREFVAAAKSGKVQANFSSMEGYLAAKLFSEGLRRVSGKPTREALVTALESIQEDFGGYRVTFGPQDHVASNFVELSMLTGDGKVRT